VPNRLELTVADLLRVRVAPSLGPLAETALAYSGLQARATPAPVRGLTRVIRDRATAADRALASYLWLSPSTGFDLFSLGGRTSSISAGQESVLDAPDGVWRAEIDVWAGMRAEARRRGLLGPAGAGSTGIEAALGSGDTDHWRRLLAQMQDRFTSWIGPSWPEIKDRLDAEEARFGRHVAAGGLEALVAALGHDLRWTGSSLELPDAGVTATHTWVVRPDGRGLTIVPSFFALQPMVYVSSEVTEPVLLIVPGAPTELSTPSRSVAGPPGAELLGRTRAAVLSCVARRPRTTSQLSHDLGIAISGASQHATVLRRAGLLTTTREGGHVQHCITELGESLLARW
jgi:DNA-binding transcriptional ArsR family regulator